MSDQLDEFREILNNLQCEGLSGDCFSAEQLEEALEYAQGDLEEAMLYLCSQAENEEEEEEDWIHHEHCDQFDAEQQSDSEDEQLGQDEDLEQDPPAESVDGHVCRNNHPIELSTSTEGVYELGNWYCDLCGTSKPPGTERWLCKLCSYDVCKRCIPGPDGEEDDDEPEETEPGLASRMQRLLRQTQLSGLIQPEQLAELEQQLGPELLRAVERQLGPSSAMMHGEGFGGLGGLGGLGGMFAPAEVGLFGDELPGSAGEELLADDTVDWEQEVAHLGLTGADTMLSHEMACARISKRCAQGLKQFVHLCALGLLETLCNVLSTTQAHSEESNTLSGAVSLASMLGCMALDWKATDELVVCRVISQRGVAFRRTALFTDRVGGGSFVPSAAVVCGVVVQGKDTRYLRGLDGNLLPLERPAKPGQSQEKLIVEISAEQSTVIVSGAAEPSANGAYECLGKLDEAQVYRISPIEYSVGQMHMFRTGCSGAYRWTLALMHRYNSPDQFLTKNVQTVLYRCTKSTSETPPTSDWVPDTSNNDHHPGALAVSSVAELQQAAKEAHKHMAEIQPKVLSLLLPSLLQCYELVQPLALEREIVSAVEAVVQRVTREQLEGCTGIQSGLCAFVKQLFETNSLATALQGLRITQLLLTTVPTLLSEMHRHGLVPAVANLKSCRDKQKQGLMRTVSGSTRPDSVSKLASKLISLVDSINAHNGDIKSLGAKTTQLLSSLACCLAEPHSEVQPVLAQLAEQLPHATPFELHSSGLVCALLQWLMQDDSWAVFEQYFGVHSEALQLLINRLHHVLSECEDLSVYTQPSVERLGLSSMLQPCELSLNLRGSSCSSSIHCQPLVLMWQVKQHLLRTTALTQPEYVDWCAKLIGATILDRPRTVGREAPGPLREAKVLGAAYCTPEGLIVHTLQYCGEEHTLQRVLAVRDYQVLALAAEKQSIQRLAQPGAGPEQPSTGDRSCTVVLKFARSGFTDRVKPKSSTAEDLWAEELEQCHMITQLPKEQCLQGLKLANGNLEMAINMLFNGQVPADSPAATGPAAAVAGSDVIWELQGIDNNWSELEQAVSVVLESAHSAQPTAELQLEEGSCVGLVSLERMTFLKHGSSKQQSLRRTELNHKLNTLLEQGVRGALERGSLDRSSSSSSLAQLYHKEGVVPLDQTAIAYLEQCVQLLVQAHGHAVLLSAEPQMWLRAVTEGRSPSLGIFMRRTFEQVLEVASAQNTQQYDVRRASQMLHPCVLASLLGEPCELSAMAQIALAVYVNSVVELLMYLGQISSKIHNMNQISAQLLVAAFSNMSDGPTAVMIEDVSTVLRNASELVAQGAAVHGPCKDVMPALCTAINQAQTNSAEGCTPYYSSQPIANFTLADRGFVGDSVEFMSLLAQLQPGPEDTEPVQLCVARAQTVPEAEALHAEMQQALEGMAEIGVSCELLRDQECDLDRHLPAALPSVHTTSSAMKLGQHVLCERADNTGELQSEAATLVRMGNETEPCAVVFDDGVFEGAVPRSRLKLPVTPASRSPFGRARMVSSSVPLKRVMTAFEQHSQDGHSASVNRIEVPKVAESSASSEQQQEDPTHPEVQLQLRFWLKTAPDAEPQLLPDDANLFQCMQLLHDQCADGAQTPWQRRYELVYEITPVLVGPGQAVGGRSAGLALDQLSAELPYPLGAGLEHLCAKVSKPEFVSTLQHLGTPEWLHRMGLMGNPEVVAAANQWARLHALYRTLCSPPPHPIDSESSRNLLLPPPLSELPTRLLHCGLKNKEARDATTLLALLHQRFSSHSELNWVNRKLTSKLRYQLEDLLSITTQVLPGWCRAVPHSLLDFSVRKELFECTSYGVAHSMHWMQERLIRRKQLRKQEQVALEREFLASVQAGQLSQESSEDEQQRQQAEMDLMQAQAVSVEIRERIREHQIGTLRVEMAKLPDLKDSEALLHVQRLFAEYSSSCSVLELTQNRDQAFGSGVTQECYTCIAALQMRHQFSEDELVFLPTGCVGSGADALVEVPPEGLFPRPIDTSDCQQVAKATAQWEFIGRLLAKALRDTYTVPLPLCTSFFKLVLGSELAQGDLPSVTPVPIRALATLARLLSEQPESQIKAMPWSAVDKSSESEASVEACFEGLGLLFCDEWITQVELHPGGAQEAVSFTADSLSLFVAELCGLWFHTGVAKQVEAFRRGLSCVFQPDQAQLFEPAELSRLMCTDTRVCWAWPTPARDTPAAQIEELERQSLFQYLCPIAGYTRESDSFHHLVGALLQLDNEERKGFLHFVTAKRGLDPGGLPSMKVQIAKPMHVSSPLPAARSCNNTLFLPEASSVQQVKHNLILAASLESCANTQGMSDQIFQ